MNCYACILMDRARMMRLRTSGTVVSNSITVKECFEGIRSSCAAKSETSQFPADICGDAHIAIHPNYDKVLRTEAGESCPRE